MLGSWGNNSHPDMGRAQIHPKTTPRTPNSTERAEAQQRLNQLLLQPSSDSQLAPEEHEGGAVEWNQEATAGKKQNIERLKNFLDNAPNDEVLSEKTQSVESAEDDFDSDQEIQRINAKIWKKE